MPRSFAEMIYAECQHQGYDPVYLCRKVNQIFIRREKMTHPISSPVFTLSKEDLREGLQSSDWDLLLIFLRGAEFYTFDDIIVRNPLLKEFP